MDLKALEKLLEYNFQNTDLLKEALSHPSLKGDGAYRGGDYERLEFLGDAVVNLIVTDILYAKFPKFDEGELAKIRSYLISKEFMVEKAREIDLGNYIELAGGEEAVGGRDNPNTLENVLEAVIGALYLDKRDFKKVFEIVQKLWGEITPDMGEMSNPKSTLQETLQEMRKGLPKYEVIDKTGEVHSPTYTVKVSAKDGLEGVGICSTIKSAEKKAARELIKLLNSKSK